MNLLLDTHMWLWGFLEPDRIVPSVAAQLEDPANILWLSPLSIWEAFLLQERGRLALHPNVEEWLARATEIKPLREASLTADAARETRRVALPHRDPVDRLLVATARVYDLTLVTADERLIAVPGLPILANRMA